MGIPVKLQVFEGPLDLLLHLIDKNKIDIYDIPIVEITNQYMDYIKAMDDYFAFWDKARAEYGVPYYPNVTMGWDPSPRYVEQTPEGIKNYLVTYTIGNNTPENFREALQRTKDRLLADPNGPRILNINSWNEWTEGSYIEPDSIHGTGYLEAIKAVFGQAAPTAAE